MNKYYIGYSIPLDVEMLIKHLYQYVDNMAVQDPSQLHITALYLGPQSHEDAMRIFNSMERRTVPIPVEFDTYARFYQHLVITLKTPPDLHGIHNRLVAAAGQLYKGRNDYNPHITIAHGKNGFVKIGCPEKKFYVSKVNLYEKQEGGEYRAIATQEFK